MRRWLVIVPVAGTIAIEVDAASREEAIDEAIEHAFDDVVTDGIDTLEAYHSLCTGNVLHVPHNEAEAKDLGEGGA